jgi:phage shock protein E
MKLEQIIKNKEGTIIDVRTPAEYQGGHATHSINIPLHEIPKRLEELQKMKTPLVLCCASGGRSAQAVHLLSNYKIECLDAGPWTNIHSFQFN